MEIRSKSQQALFKQNSLEAVDVALRARSRTQGGEARQIPDGSWCYCWRSKGGKKGWAGPGVCITSTPVSRFVWLRKRLLKCSHEQVRPATDEEWQGADLMAILSDSNAWKNAFSTDLFQRR